MSGAVLAVLLAVIRAEAIETPTIPSDSVDTKKIQSDAVTGPKIISFAIDSNKIATAAVGTEKVTSGAINTNKVENGAIQTQKLDNDAVDTKKLMYTAHRVQSIGVGDGAIATGPDALTIRGTSAMRGATTVVSSSLTVQSGAVFGAGVWPTATIGQSGDRTGIFASGDDGYLIVGNMQSGVGTNRVGRLWLGGRATSGTDDLTRAVLVGGRENATSGNFSSYFAVQTSGGAESMTEAIRVDSGQRLGVGTSNPGTKLHMSSGTLTVDGTSALIKIGDAASTATPGQLIASPPAAQTIGAGGTIAADACGGVKIVTAAGAVTTDTTNTVTAPAAANAGCCMDIVNTGATNTITLDQNANNDLAADTALGPCDVIRACSTGASGRWYFNAVFNGTCN